jgi:hypothetical protein
MGAKPKYTESYLKMLLYQTKQGNPGKELNPYNLSQLTEVPLHVWRDRMKPAIELINDKQFLNEWGELKKVESMPFPIINYVAEFSALIDKKDSSGILSLAKEIAISHMKLLNSFSEKQKLNSQSNEEHTQINLIQNKDKEIAHLHKQLNAAMDRASIWENKYNELAVKAIRNIQRPRNNIIHLKPLSSADKPQINEKL